MKIRATLCALLMAGSLASCVSKGPSPSIPFQNYDVTLSLTGPLALAPTSFGVIKVPSGSTGLASLGLIYASSYLKAKEFKKCVFTPAVEISEGGVITASSTASCTLNGVPVVEVVALSLTPVASTETATLTVAK